jgi:hypothetical protein
VKIYVRIDIQTSTTSTIVEIYPTIVEIYPRIACSVQGFYSYIFVGVRGTFYNLVQEYHNEKLQFWLKIIDSKV